MTGRFFVSSRTWLLLTVAIALLVRTPTMFGVKRSGWDEHAYMFFAHTLHDKGVPGIQRLLTDYATNENLKQSPLPLRITFVALASVTCQVLGKFDVNNVAWLSFCSGIALIVVGFLFAERLVGRFAAMVTTPLLISSPLAAGLSRRAMQDTFTALVFVLVLYLFDRCWRRASWANYVAFGAVFAGALLTKETALFLLPLMVCAAVYYMRAMRLAFRWPILLSLAVAAMVYILVETYLAGGISRFIDTYRTYAALQHQLTYPLHYEHGPWFIYLLAFLAVAPLAFVAAIVGLTVPPDDEARHGRILACLYLVTGILVFAQLPIVNVRLVLFLDLFLRIAAALAIIYFARVVTTKWRSGVLVALIGVLVLADAAQFYRVFVRGNVYNPNTFLLLRAEGFYDVE